MTEILGVPIQAVMGHMLLGLINGSFYALLSLGLAVIFGMMNVINMAHGAFYMLGAFVAWLFLTYLGVGYWPSLIIAPIVVGLFALVVERVLLRHLYDVHHLYGMLLTLGVAMIIEGGFQQKFGVSGQPYPIPAPFNGGVNLGFMYLPIYRGWVIIASLIVCFGTWFAIERTRLGAYLRAATENAELVQVFGINVPLMIALTYAFGVGLAALGGVLAAPIYQVNPLMGGQLIIVVFAVVVIGGMGSILGSIVTGLSLGIAEGITKIFYPEGANMVVFIIMIIVLITRPSGLLGRE